MLAAELPCYLDLPPLAGTLDALVLDRSTARLAVLDIKTGNPYRWHLLQAAIYGEALRFLGIPVDDILVLYLGYQGRLNTLLSAPLPQYAQAAVAAAYQCYDALCARLPVSAAWGPLYMDTMDVSYFDTPEVLGETSITEEQDV